MTPNPEHGKYEDPVEAALELFREAWFAGERLEPKAFCRSHPECGPELKDEIEDFLFTLERPPFGGLEMDEEKRIEGRLIGDFRIIREIGSGGMGTVYEAEQLSLKRRVLLSDNFFYQITVCSSMSPIFLSDVQEFNIMLL